MLYSFLAAVQPIHWSIKKTFCWSTDINIPETLPIGSFTHPMIPLIPCVICWFYRVQRHVFVGVFSLKMPRLLRLWGLQFGGLSEELQEDWQLDGLGQRGSDHGSLEVEPEFELVSRRAQSANGARWGSRCVRVPGLQKRGNMKQAIEVLRCSI